MSLSARDSGLPFPFGRLAAPPQPERSGHALLDGSWWPDSPDLDFELGVLMPFLDHVRGPVERLVLSAGDWVGGPHRIVVDARTVGVDYRTGQPPWTMTVVCADGGTFTMRVVPPGPAPVATDGAGQEPGEDVWETDGGGLGASRLRGPMMAVTAGGVDTSR